MNLERQHLSHPSVRFQKQTANTVLNSVIRKKLPRCIERLGLHIKCKHSSKRPDLLRQEKRVMTVACRGIYYP